jgi:hypothetical protein
LPNAISAPNGAFADFSVIAHEIGEMITDPYANAFHENQGFENGDRCAGILGGCNFVSGTNVQVNNAIPGTTTFANAVFP